MKIKYPNSAGKRTVKCCLKCNSEFSTLDIRIRQGGEKFCSKKCYFDYKRENSGNKKALNSKHQRKNKYGITQEEYLNLYNIHNSSCAICGINEDQLPNKKLFLDHCHKTNIIRGLLCSKCNSALGMVDDNIEVLKKATAYLEKFIIGL